MNHPIRVETGNPASALLLAFTRDAAELFRNPLALIGGIGGLALTSLALFLGGDALAKAADAAAAAAAAEDEFEIDFTPGTIARLGEKLDEKDIPQKIIVQETRAEDWSETEPAKESVTTDETVKPAETPPAEKPKEIAKEKPKFQDNKDKKLPTAKVPTTSNTPFKKDLPTVQQNQGDPFGDPEGWDDLTRDGDPWATEVMKKLNNMPIGAYAAKAAKGDYKFQLRVCKDGKLGTVLSKGGSLPEDGKNAVRLALESLTLPKPPKKISDAMPGNCALLRYTFVWSASGVK